MDDMGPTPEGGGCERTESGYIRGVSRAENGVKHLAESIN